MTATVRKTNKGWIVTNDGFSESYRAYVQGNLTFKVYIPLSVASCTSQPDYLIDLATQVVRTRHNDYRTDGEKACRVLASGRIE